MFAREEHAANLVAVVARTGSEKTQRYQRIPGYGGGGAAVVPVAREGRSVRFAGRLSPRVISSLLSRLATFFSGHLLISVYVCSKFQSTIG